MLPGPIQTSGTLPLAMKLIAFGIALGIAGALLLMVGGSNGWPWGYYGSPGHSARLLLGLGGITIMLGLMMYFGSRSEVVSRRPTVAAV